MTKKMINAKVTSGHVDVSIDPYDLEGTLDEAISHLQKMKDMYKDRNVKLVYKEDPWSDYKSFYLYEQRLENDEEYQKRLEKEERHIEYKREQFERLKKELGE